MPLENSSKSRRLMHTRSIECEGFLRDDGLWEVEAWLRDTKPFTQRADRFRDELKPGDPVHDIGLRLAIDDGMTIREAEAMMRATPYPTCVEVEPILRRLIGERVGPGWRALSVGAARAAGNRSPQAPTRCRRHQYGAVAPCW